MNDHSSVSHVYSSKSPEQLLLCFQDRIKFVILKLRAESVITHNPRSKSQNIDSVRFLGALGTNSNADTVPSIAAARSLTQNRLAILLRLCRQTSH